MEIIDRINKRLLERKEKGNLRYLKTSQNLIDFYSNDYLGLSRSKSLNQKISDYYLAVSNISNGATGSRLLSGNSAYFEDVENQLAGTFKAKSALIFNSGYNACQAVVATIPSRGDTILYDEYIHACAKDGARLSQSRFYSFRHNDVDDLEKKLKLATGICYVVIESVYSMDGDMPPILDIIKLCNAHDALLIVDEAHSTGVYGLHGSGLICELNLQDQVFIRIHTFGKAMGVHGACVVSSQEVKDYLINFARAFIFTTALPMHSIISIKAAFEVLANSPELSNQLFDNIKRYKNNLQVCGLNSSDSSIQTVKMKGNQKVKALSKTLQEAGLDVRPILSPTVKEGEERLRICLHNFNTNNEIDQLTALISHHNS